MGILSDKFRILFSKILFGNGFMHNIAVLAGGMALAQGLTVLVSPILTRLYMPDDLARLGLFLAFIGPAVTVVSLRYEFAIPVARDDDEAIYLVVACILIAAVMSIVACLLFGILIRSELLGFGILPLWTTVIAYPALFLMVTFLILRYWFIREKEVNVISQVTIFQGVGRALVQVILGIIQLEWMGLVIGEIAGRTLGLSHMVKRIWTKLTSSILPFNFQNLVIILKHHYKFPLYSMPSTLLNSLSISLPLPIIAQLHGSTAAGYFALVQRVLAVPLVLIGKSTTDAFHGHIAAYARQDPQKVRSLFFRTAGTLTLLGLAPTVLLMVLGPWLFGLVFGQVWMTSGLIASLMAPWSLAQFVVSPLSSTLPVLGRQELKFIYDFFSIGGVGIAFYMGWAFNFSLVTFMLLLSGLQVLAYIIYFLVLVYAIFQLKTQ